MNLLAAQYDGLYGAAQSELRGSILVRSQRKRDWLAQVVRKAIDEECGVCGGVQSMGRNYQGMFRDSMIANIKDRVHHENKKCGSIILTVILMAVLSWLIQRMLDWLFLSEEH